MHISCQTFIDLIGCLQSILTAASLHKMSNKALHNSALVGDLALMPDGLDAIMGEEGQRQAALRSGL